MVLIKHRDQVEVLEELSAPPNEQLSDFRRLTVNLTQGRSGWAGGEPSTEIGINHGNVQDALKITLHRTIRVPDNRDTNSLPPSLGSFPLYKVQDFAAAMPEGMARKGGLFFSMYQREAMWISFSASEPFAIKIYVGGVNAISGLPMTENEKTKEKRLRMMRAGKPVQDYMVVPGQRWLDGIVSEDGKIRQFVAKPKGSGYSVEAQVTGEETVGGTQIEIIPAKRGGVPADLDIRYENEENKVITRTVSLAQHNITEQSTWLDLKAALQKEFGVDAQEQSLRPYLWTSGYNMRIDDNTKLGDSYFKPNLVLHLSRCPKHRDFPFVYRRSGYSESAFGGSSAFGSASVASPGLSLPPPPSCPIPAPTAKISCNRGGAPTYRAKHSTSRNGATSRARLSAAAAVPPVREMGLAAGGLIQQVIEPDEHPADTWDAAASVVLHVQILDSETFGRVTGLPPPATPVDGAAYAQHGYPFFEVWGEEKTGIRGDFGEVKSAARIDAERAAERGEQHREEDSVPQRVWTIGRFASTFKPVDRLKQELEGLKLDG